MDGNNMLGTVTVWAQDAIDQITIADTNPERGKKDLSCSYFYDLVPENGEFEGQKYDFKMVNIRGNHVALVPDGRVPTAMIADSNNNSILKGSGMKKTKKLAADAKDCNTMSDAEMNVAGELKKIATDADYEGQENERLAAMVKVLRDLTKIQSEEAAAGATASDADEEDNDKNKPAADSEEDAPKEKEAANDEEDTDKEEKDKKAMADAINAGIAEYMRIKSLCEDVLGDVSPSFARDSSTEEMVKKTLKAKGFACDATYKINKIKLETLAEAARKNQSASLQQTASDSSYRSQVKIISKSLFEGK
ncbi:MAG: prohead protease [Caudoviricetes sp.]|nr:MAG: prohead protease [Caudoviricetes sp.]